MRKSICANQYILITALLWGLGIVNAIGQENKDSSKDGAATTEIKKSDEVTVVGLLHVSWNKKAQRVGQLIVDIGKEGPATYNIIGTPEGDRCMRIMKGKTTAITGVITNKNGHNWLTVKSFKEANNLKQEKMNSASVRFHSDN